MKSRITIILLLTLFAQVRSFAQYETYDMMYQMQMQMYQQQLHQAYQQNQSNYTYNCFDGKSISCTITMARMTGFSSVSATIQNRDRTMRKSLTVETYTPVTITISVGEPEWTLSYGDRITITYDGGSTKTLEVGNSDNMSEVDWERYKSSLIAGAKQQDLSVPFNNVVSNPPSQNSNSTTVRKEKCPSCGGSGVSSGWLTIAGYGSSEQHWCDVCKMMVSATHGPHPKCNVCGGKGFWEKISY